jgi:hypothetical protein
MLSKNKYNAPNNDVSICRSRMCVTVEQEIHAFAIIDNTICASVLSVFSLLILIGGEKIKS